MLQCPPAASRSVEVRVCGSLRFLVPTTGAYTSSMSASSARLFGDRYTFSCQPVHFFGFRHSEPLAKHVRRSAFRCSLHFFVPTSIILVFGFGRRVTSHSAVTRNHWQSMSAVPLSVLVTLFSCVPRLFWFSVGSLGSHSDGNHWHSMSAGSAFWCSLHFFVPTSNFFVFGHSEPLA